MFRKRARPPTGRPTSLIRGVRGRARCDHQIDEATPTTASPSAIHNVTTRTSRGTPSNPLEHDREVDPHAQCCLHALRVAGEASIVSPRSGWYLTPRSMSGWQLRLVAVVGPLVAAGAGLLAGGLLVRVPSKTEYVSMPAPSWLAWTGLGCCAAAVAALALARCTSPLYESHPDTPSLRPKPVRAVRPTEVWSATTFAVGLVTCSVVSSSSDYRWRPLWLLALMLVAMPVAWAADAAHRA